MKTISRYLHTHGYLTKGKEAHHWNYNLPYSVIIISRTSHKLLHKFMRVDYNDKHCYKLNGERLESEKQAIDYFKSCLLSNGIHENIKVLNLKQMLL